MISTFRFGWLEYFLKKNPFIRLWQFVFGVLFLHSRQISYNLFTMVNFGSRDKVLDIGCGDGNFSNWISYCARAEVLGVDRLENRLENARRVAIRYKLRSKFRCINIESEDLDFPDETFTKILLIDVLEHLRKPEIIISKCARWLRPDGILVISAPLLNQKSWFFKESGDYFIYGQDYHYHKGFTLKLIRNWLGQSGLQYKVREREIFFALYQLTWEFSEKIRRISPNLYRLIVPLLHPLLIFDRLWPLGQQGNGFILIAKK